MRLGLSFHQVPQRFPRLILNLDDPKTHIFVAMRFLNRNPKSVCRYEKLMSVVTPCGL